MSEPNQTDIAKDISAILSEIAFLRDENARLRRAHINNYDSLKDPDSDEASRLARDIYWSSSKRESKHAMFMAYKCGRDLQFKDHLERVSAQDHAEIDRFYDEDYFGGCASDYEYSRVLLKLIKLGREAESGHDRA
jgi:hypothetical protein